MIATLFLLISLLTFPLASEAQQDQQQIRAVIDQVFDAMRTGEADQLADAFHPEATLKTVAENTDGVSVMHGDIQAFINQVGSPRSEVWDEHIFNVHVHSDGNLAAAWMDYTFYVGENFSHCGVNAFEFIRTQSGWKVLGITDTRRSTGCVTESR